MIVSVAGLVLFASLAFAGSAHKKIVHGQGRQAREMAQRVHLDDINIQEKELVNLMDKQVYNNEDLEKLVPKKIITNGSPAQQPLPHHEKNWARKMSEKQWREQRVRLQALGQDGGKAVLNRNRNTINDNRHDKKAMKLARHFG